MKPKGGVTLIITVGGAENPSHGHSVKSKKGNKMIKVPIDALASDTEEGVVVEPVAGDEITLDAVGGVVGDVVDGVAHVEISSVNGVPVEYGDLPAEEDELADAEMDVMGDELLAAAAVQDEEMGL